MPSKSQPFVAHYRPEDQVIQAVWEHMQNVGVHAEMLAEKIGLGTLGRLAGSVHDLGKATDAFNAYIRVAAGISEELRADVQRIDHSTAGGQWIRNLLSQEGAINVAADVLALLVTSHHGGLLDCVSPTGESVLWRRLSKAEEHTRLNEALSNIPGSYRSQMEQIVADADVEKKLVSYLQSLQEPGDCRQTLRFRWGLAIRFLFSALVDADRIDTIDFHDPNLATIRQQHQEPAWNAAVEALESHLTQFSSDTKVNAIRRSVSVHCLTAAERQQGLYRLTVPTGGGKTLASLRFALHHVAHHGMDRIIYVIPYTSIIDQNAIVIRSILDTDQRCEGMVLEHHSNLEPEAREDKKHLLFCQNWDAPIIVTTMVQFLETLFGSGTNSVRRMHALSRAVLIFDEIQTLPIRCIHMFNGALRYLVNHCGSTAVLCTATQPLLHKVEPENRSLPYEASAELTADVHDLFAQLKRVTIRDCTNEGSWNVEHLTQRAVQELDTKPSCLIIVNTKRQAAEIFRSLDRVSPAPAYHLSTNMCPTHRKDVLLKVKRHLESNEPVICISTQLIEAGVDIDFDVVFRALAGLDSIQQASGRCNRHGRNNTADVFVFELAGESLRHLVDIREGKQVTKRLLTEFRDNPAEMDYDLLSPRAMERYYRYYFFRRQNQMSYPVSPKSPLGIQTDLYELLSTNEAGVRAFRRRTGSTPPPLTQAFASAASLFDVIEQNGRGVIVPYGTEGNELITELCALDPWQRSGSLLAKAQQYSVNVHPQVLADLNQRELVRSIADGLDIYYVDESAYDKDLGLQQDAGGIRSTLCV